MSGCKNCGKPLGKSNRTGFCRAHSNGLRKGDPVFAAKLRAEMNRRLEDPEYRAKLSKSAKRAREKLLADPAFAERMREIGKRQYVEVLSKPDVREKNRNAPNRAQRVSDTKLAHIPAEYRGQYRELMRQRVGYENAIAMIEAKVADERALRSGQLGDALFWLRRLGPVTQLDDGRYRIGSAVLTPGELWQRAVVKGWNPAVAA
jgi:hypothetical protein